MEISGGLFAVSIYVGLVSRCSRVRFNCYLRESSGFWGFDGGLEFLGGRCC